VIWSAACRNSSKPVPQMRCTRMAGTATGTPLYRPMWRGRQKASTSACAIEPAITESMSSGCTPARASASRPTLMPMSVGDRPPKAPQ
jgi:hypothetical protein